MSKTAFIGHRKVYQKDIVKDRVGAAIAERIKCGCKSFIVGTHGEFDSLALSLCRKARESYPDLEIDVVLTSYHQAEKKDGCIDAPYRDVTAFLYDIEDEHFKRQITVSNRKMIDECDTLICYVDEKKNPSGAKMAMNYAKRRGLRIINVFRAQDEPSFGMTEEERKKFLEKRFAEVSEKKLSFD